jgi:hypothetical protein
MARHTLEELELIPRRVSALEEMLESSSESSEESSSSESVDNLKVSNSFSIGTHRYSSEEKEEPQRQS